MKPSMLLIHRCTLIISVTATAASAFQLLPSSIRINRPTSIHHDTTAILSNSDDSINYIDTSEYLQRDINPMISWCEMYGVDHTSIDFCPTSSFKQLSNSQDYTCYAVTDLPAGSPVLTVPSSILLDSYHIKHNEVGELSRSEEFLTKLREPLPLFYLYVKLLYEYSLGDTSPYYDWLNSLPRSYDTGTSMTPTCYDCLPPLAATYAKTERVRYINYQSAVKNTVDWLPEWIVEDVLVCKWIFNVVSTRSWDVGDGSGERVIVPMGDMVRYYEALCR